MKAILVPGFWLDGSSWSDTLPALEAAGHEPIPFTLPGMGADRADAAAVTLDDQVDAVVAALDEAAVDGSPVALVGHSGGGTVIGVVTDRRPELVARAVYVDSGPLAEGGSINDELPIEEGVIPLPDWGFFEEEELAGLDPAALDAFRARSIPTPAHVANDAVHLGDERRWTVPTVVVASTMSSELLQQLIAKDHPYVREIAKLHQVRYIDLPTGHWPQFSRPADLGAAIVDALS
ncbi:alpha/beta hydrolase [Schumannella luteola]|uniref:Pimeloyl-ACP methyl ester carboxylesterase n=1 Tax=Schumannella luteola TaxID=472059 RepID=A0A852YK82_9MICO|nr:pimeloyl-ACP methyl ester carboxylesterase [Schumannella luteola]TPX01993.1 alpha/beta hydrolase [Schumannella luteola]